ncbi:MAG: hypothetical protein ACKO0Z_19465 [Betaproteobacteria bacterium]
MRQTHGEVRRVNGKRVATPEYRSWQMMRNRCLNPKARDYAYYGGRGITVCKAWGSFENFLADMGRRPTSVHTLERKNVARNYTPSNCVWATRKEQARNRTYAATRHWELAEKLAVAPATAQHYLWVLRRALNGRPTRYTVPAEAIKIIKKHMGDKL